MVRAAEAEAGSDVVKAAVFVVLPCVARECCGSFAAACWVFVTRGDAIGTQYCGWERRGDALRGAGTEGRGERGGNIAKRPVRVDGESRREKKAAL